ncbi:MAG: hypothetical protein NTX36_05230 [Proteobacteria bacterium]|nr:hypothetical protein [Pseudomonadota bacterium]
MTNLMSYDLKHGSVSEVIAATVAAIIEISGKSTRTMLRTISILKLFSEEPELSATFAEILIIVGKSIITLSCKDAEGQTVLNAELWIIRKRLMKHASSAFSADSNDPVEKRGSGREIMVLNFRLKRRELNDQCRQ